jgi:hypothetical protein
MRQEQDLSATADALSLSELLARYLSGQAARFAAGGPAPDLGSEVSLHDVSGAAQAIDPRLAWDEAIAALSFGGARPAGSLPAPCSAPDWKLLAASQEPALDLAFCTGNFPQMVRNLGLLLGGIGERKAETSRPRAFRSDALVEWAEKVAAKSPAHTLLGAGVLRLTQEFDRAGALLRSVEKVPEEWRATWQNEEAALAWHAGRREEAAGLWQACGDRHHLPTLFNVGMAALFLGRPSEARPPLSQAVSRLPDDNSWHHLARLYLTLAEMRGA